MKNRMIKPAVIGSTLVSVMLISPVFGERDPLGGVEKELGIIGSREGAESYAFMKPVYDLDEFKNRQVPSITISLKPTEDPFNPSDIEWTVINGNASSYNNQLRDDLTINWYLQASCTDDLTHLEVDGPGGKLVQNPLSNPISGYFKYQSFSIDSVKQVCVNWANDNDCNPAADAGCQLFEDFILENGVEPVKNDTIKLNAICASGQIAASPEDVFYTSQLKLRCAIDPLF